MKRWIAMLLAALLICCLPFPGMAQSISHPAAGSWEAIRQIEGVLDAGALTQTEAELTSFFAQNVDQMIRAVKSAPDYVPGSLERHGSFFFWRTTDGRANGYSPSLRAQIMKTQEMRDEQAATVGILHPDTAAENLPENRDVGVFIPYSNSYYFYADRCIAEGQRVAESTGGTLRVYTAENTNITTLAEVISTCGFLLINSHGRTDYEWGNDNTSKANSSFLCIPTGEGITAEDQKPVTGQFGTYYHAFYAGSSDHFDEEYYCVDGTCIANHMPSAAPHSMIWLGCCLGMATEGMFTPLRQKGVEAIIGFSESVSSNADHEYRGVFVNTLLQDGTVGEAAAAMKAEVGCPDPYLPSDHPAYPIAVSSQDPYPGRSHLAEGQEVHSDWKLYPAHPISVTMEPENSADVLTIRNQLVITPHRGFTFSDWELTDGEAAVTRSGNQLLFVQTGPCAVTLHMAARTPARLEFSAGPGQSAAEINEFIEDTVELPEPAGTLEADAFVYHFLGWTRESLQEDSVSRPTLLPVGAKLTLTQPETVLYAVYGYFDPEDGASQGQFRLMDAEPENWAGDYVLTYQSTKALRAESIHTGQGILSPLAVASNTSAGYFVDGAWLNEVPDELVYTFQANEGGIGTLKMKTSENYLAVPSSTVMLTTVTDGTANGASWRMKWVEDKVLITNTRFPSRILQYSPTSSGFCTLTTLRGPLTLYVRVPGTHRYTTAPGFRTDPPEPPVHVHTWAEPVYTWSTDNLTVLAETHCTEDPAHQLTETAAATVTVLAEPDYDTEGETLYRVAFENPVFSTQTKTVKTPRLERPSGPQLPCDGGADCPGKHFTDMPEKGNWAHDPIDWAIVNHITSGTSATTFSPKLGCTRAQAMTFLWRAAGSPAPDGLANPFRDLPDDAYYRQAVLWAVDQGITSGTAANTFSPDQACTRAQIVTFLWRFEGSPAPQGQQDSFRDVKDGDYFAKAVLWATQQGITSGTGDGFFSPGATCTREQIVTFLYKDHQNRS